MKQPVINKRRTSLALGLVLGILPLAGWSPAALIHRVDDSFKMGAIPSSEKNLRSAWRLKRTNVGTAEVPPHLEFRDFLPPVGRQTKSDCVAWSSAYYAYTYAVAKQRKLTPEQRTDKFTFSPQYLYPHINNGADGGSMVALAMKWLADKGCATLDETPYDEKDFLTQPTPAAEERASHYIARKTVCLASRGSHPFDPDEVREYMSTTQLPVVTAIALLKDFPGGAMSSDRTVASDFVWNTGLEPSNATFWGNHALAIVGYDTTKNAFLIVNSWGTGWGADGFLWINEDYLKKFTIETWGFVPGGFVAREGRVPQPIKINNRLSVVPPTAKESK